MNFVLSIFSESFPINGFMMRNTRNSYINNFMFIVQTYERYWNIVCNKETVLVTCNAQANNILYFIFWTKSTCLSTCLFTLSAYVLFYKYTRMPNSEKTFTTRKMQECSRYDMYYRSMQTMKEYERISNMVVYLDRIS